MKSFKFENFFLSENTIKFWDSRKEESFLLDSSIRRDLCKISIFFEFSLAKNELLRTMWNILVLLEDALIILMIFLIFCILGYSKKNEYEYWVSTQTKSQNSSKMSYSTQTHFFLEYPSMKFWHLLAIYTFKASIKMNAQWSNHQGYNLKLALNFL